MGQAQINVRTRACSRTSIARTKQAALTHNVRGKELNTYFSRGGNFRNIPEFGFDAKFSSGEINICCEWNFANFSSLQK